jgi:diaminohydroxyphosphoribosylaminopyrimidine deaminase/5-amino-6-(5-phosphoribosylamino)uracil reductase
MELRSDAFWMARALEWADRGKWTAAPNPMVGCVIVARDGRLLGEGFHYSAGGPHAEIAALNAVREEDRGEIAGATVYVTLEPCSHHGRTPPCADRLVAEGVGRVVVAIEDPFPEVSGRGIDRLREAGIPVDLGCCASRAAFQNRRFLHAHRTGMPFVVLKWAQSADGYFDPRQAPAAGSGMVAITDPGTRRLSHAWRAWEQGILIGGRTAAIDHPRLDVRDAPGRSPLRFILDPNGSHLADGQAVAAMRAVEGEIWHIHSPGIPCAPGCRSLMWEPSTGLVELLRNIRRETGILSLLVEGGKATLQAFLDAGIWNEMRVLTSNKSLGGGLLAPHPHPPLPSPYDSGTSGPDSWTCTLAQTSSSAP